MKRVRRPSPAMTVALVALFVALGGTGYAAFKVPNNSVGSKQLKADAVKSSKVMDGSLLAGDFKAGQLPAGQRGPQGEQGLKGDKGDPCGASDPSCKGPAGDTGPQGPGTQTFSGQFTKDPNVHFASLGGALSLEVTCDTSGAVTVQVLGGEVTTGSFYGWGTNWDGTTFQRATLVRTPGGTPLLLEGHGQNEADLDVTVEYTPAGGAVKYTHVAINILVGNACNYHALVIPPS
jgi:hypothetical protein